MQEIKTVLDGSLVQEIEGAFISATEAFTQLDTEEQLNLPGSKKELQYSAVYWFKVLFRLSSHHPDINLDIKKTASEWLFQKRDVKLNFSKGSEVFDLYADELVNKGILKYGGR